MPPIVAWDGKKKIPETMSTILPAIPWALHAYDKDGNLMMHQYPIRSTERSLLTSGLHQMDLRMAIISEIFQETASGPSIVPIHAHKWHVTSLVGVRISKSNEELHGCMEPANVNATGMQF